MENKDIIKNLVKLQILCMRWVERNTNLECVTYRDINRIIMGGKLTCTYKEAVKNLKNNIEKYCKENNYMMEEILKLEEAINENEIANLRFGIEPQKKFSEIENELDSLMIKRQLFMSNGMVGIKYVVENLGLKESAVKQACQQQRLLNTRKIGKSWMVHIPECRSYWNIPDTDPSHLYKDLEY